RAVQALGRGGLNALRVARRASCTLSLRTRRRDFMRIGLPGLGSTVDDVVRRAERAEADGFATLWFNSAAAGDPLLAIAIAGRETSRIELGTAIVQTYTSHPLLMASRAAAVVSAIGAPRFTLGVGPSHKPVIEGVLGLSYDHAGRHTDEYVQIPAPLLPGEA